MKRLTTLQLLKKVSFINKLYFLLIIIQLLAVFYIVSFLLADFSNFVEQFKQL